MIQRSRVIRKVRNIANGQRNAANQVAISRIIVKGINTKVKGLKRVDLKDYQPHVNEWKNQ